MIRVRKTLSLYWLELLVWSVALALSLSQIGCQRLKRAGLLGEGEPNPSPTPTATLNPSRVAWLGPLSLSAGACQPYTLVATDDHAQPVPFPSQAVFQVEVTGEAQLFSDSACSLSTSEIVFPSATSEQTIFAYSVEGGPNTLVAASSGLGMTSTSDPITVLPETDLSFSVGAELNFADTLPGESANATVTLTNAGISSVRNLNYLNLSGPFSRVSSTMPLHRSECRNQLGGGETCQLQLRFSPTTAGTFVSSLVVQFFDGTSTSQVSLALRGSSQPAGTLVAKQTFALGNADDRALALAVQPDGKWLLAGYSNLSTSGNDFSALRLTADGNLDGTFGNSGSVTISQSNSDDRALAVQIDSAGRVVLAGYSFQSNYDFSLARLTSDGIADPSFGIAGKAQIPIGSGHDYAFAAAVQSADRIVVTGYSQQAGQNRCAVLRLLANGTADTTFAGTGSRFVPMGSTSAYCYATLSLPDDSVLLAGSATLDSADFAIAKLKPDGTEDSAFATGGSQLVDIDRSSDYAYALTRDGSQRILVAGATFSAGRNHTAIVRLTADGRVDPSFANLGKKTLVLGDTDEARAIQVQADQKIVLVGSASSAGKSNLVVSRLDAGGALDPAFGSSGTLAVSFGAATDRGYALAISASGAIAAAGDSSQGAGNFDYSFATITP